jgi:hypothetical protein
MKKIIVFAAIFFTVVGMVTFYSRGSDAVPLTEIQKSLSNVPTYSVILEDMKEDGNFFKDYYHNYRIIEESPETTDDLEARASETGWLQVPENFYQTTAGLLGMVIAGKVAGDMISSPAPPGYQYIGNPRYGSWMNDPTGRSYWGWNRTPIFFHMGLDRYPPAYQKDYGDYQTARSRNTPYFGDNLYGTNGSVTQKTQPNFFERRMAKQQAKSASFSEKVSQRIGRTRTSFRGGGGGTGK